MVLVARQRAADRTCRIKVPSSPAPLRSEPQAAKGMRQARAAGSGGRPSPATCTRPGISVGSARHYRTPGPAVTVPGRMFRVAATLHAAALRTASGPRAPAGPGPPSAAPTPGPAKHGARPIRRPRLPLLGKLRFRRIWGKRRRRRPRPGAAGRLVTAVPRRGAPLRLRASATATVHPAGLCCACGRVCHVLAAAACRRLSGRRERCIRIRRCHDSRTRISRHSTGSRPSRSGSRFADRPKRFPQARSRTWFLVVRSGRSGRGPQGPGGSIRVLSGGIG